MVVASSIRSVRITATAQGWLKYGSPDLRFWFSWAFSAYW